MTCFIIWFVLILVCLHAERGGRGDGDGGGWREEWRVERSQSACWILIPGMHYSFVHQMVRREGLGDARSKISHWQQGQQQAWQHGCIQRQCYRETTWRRGKLDIHTVTSLPHIADSSSQVILPTGNFLSNTHMRVTMEQSFFSQRLLCLLHCYMCNMHCVLRLVLQTRLVSSFALLQQGARHALSSVIQQQFKNL